jgi:Helix-turn-helix domain
LRAGKRRSKAAKPAARSGRRKTQRIVSKMAREKSEPQVDRAAVSAVETRPAATTSVTPMLGTMEKEHFGIVLRRARENRAIQLSEVAQTTRVARTTLELMERGELALLPAPVYVRGFIRAYARAVATDEAPALSLYDRALASRQAAEKAKAALPTVAPETSMLSMGGGGDDESMAPRRGLGLAVFVIILLLIATITLSLLLRRPPQSGEGLSLLPGSSQWEIPARLRETARSEVRAPRALEV